MSAKPTISTNLSVHWTSKLEATSTRTDGAPLQLHCIGDHYEVGAKVTIYLADQVLTDRLVIAINETIAARKVELAAEALAA